jgi:hypothetical protein
MRTGDDKGAIVSMLVRPARFVFGLGPRNDWQTVLYRPGGDNRTQSDAQIRGSPEIATALWDVVIGSNG